MSIMLDSNKYGSVGEYLKENTNRKSNIDISSSIFTIYAYDKLKGILNKNLAALIMKNFSISAFLISTF